MKKVSSRVVILNDQKRIFFRSSGKDFEVLRAIRKLPECTWSIILSGWHIKFFDNYINTLNLNHNGKIIFYDITDYGHIEEYVEIQPNKKINIQFDPVKNQFTLRFLYDHELVNLIKSSYNHTYNQSEQSWSVEETYVNYPKIISHLRKTKYQVEYGENPGNSETINLFYNSKIISQFKESLINKNYSASTINQYISNITTFLKNTDDRISWTIENLEDFLKDLFMRKNYSSAYKNQLINSVRIYLDYLNKGQLKKPISLRSRRDYKLPEILSKREIYKMISSIRNFKHRIILGTIYITGIRPNEAVDIRTQDINLENGTLLIRKSYSGTERIIYMPEFLIVQLTKYCRLYFPGTYLFEGFRGKPYNIRSIQIIMKKSLKTAGIQKNVSVRNLRYSCAVHMLEEGISPDRLQVLLGLKNSESIRKFSKYSEILS